MTLAQLNSLLARVAEAQTPEFRDRAWNMIVEEFQDRSDWIDPQRIVELAEGYTDDGKPGWVELVFSGTDPLYVNQWEVRVPNKTVFGKTADAALKEAEA